VWPRGGKTPPGHPDEQESHVTITQTSRYRGVLATVLAGATGVVMTSGTSQAASHGTLTNIQILSFNDFHGILEARVGPEASS
jgi:hypothetical protein